MAVSGLNQYLDIFKNRIYYGFKNQETSDVLLLTFFFSWRLAMRAHYNLNHIYGAIRGPLTTNIRPIVVLWRLPVCLLIIEYFNTFVTRLKFILFNIVFFYFYDNNFCLVYEFLSNIGRNIIASSAMLSNVSFYGMLVW